MKRTETRKQAIRRILLRWFDQRKNAADNKTSYQSGTTANTEIPKADKGKRAVPTDNEKTIADSHKPDMPSRKSNRKTPTGQERIQPVNVSPQPGTDSTHLLASRFMNLEGGQEPSESSRYFPYNYRLTFLSETSRPSNGMQKKKTGINSTHHEFHDKTAEDPLIRPGRQPPDRQNPPGGLTSMFQLHKSLTSRKRIYIFKRQVCHWKQDKPWMNDRHTP